MRIQQGAAGSVLRAVSCYQHARVMFGIGPGEMMVIVIVLLIAVGPNRVPEFARIIAKTMRELRKASSELRAQSGIDKVLGHEDLRELREALDPNAKIVDRMPKGVTLKEADLDAELPPEGVDVRDARVRSIERAELDRSG